MVRFFRNVAKADNGCWVWTAFKWKLGYGCFWFGGKNIGAYRWLYQQIRGPVAPELELDHLCRNPACVNPWHLEAVTPAENQRRGVGFAGVNYRKVSCIRGHSLAGENLYITPDGRRQCRSCQQARDAKSLARRAGKVG